MAIRGNTTSLLGDTFLIIPTKPLGRIKTIDGVNWVVSGETVNWFYKKEYCIQINGGSWSSWDDINNLYTYPIDETVFYQVQFKFTHSKSATASGVSPVLSFTSVTLEGENIPVECGHIYNGSPFGQWFPCDENLAWCLNVANKMYERGIVPNFILRGDGVDDEDYKVFWKVVSCFFSIIVEFGRRVSRYNEDVGMLKTYLKARTLFFCEGSADLAELQALSHELIRRVQKRGSWAVLLELKRYICYDPIDEFIFNLRPNKYVGWNIGNSSPTYKSIHNQDTLNKNYEPNGGFTDLSLYPLVGAPIIDGDDLQLNVGDGIGDAVSQAGKSIVISPYLNYAIQFDVSVSSVTDEFTVGVSVMDENDTVLDTHNIEDDTIDNAFVNAIKLNRAGEWYNFIGILYNYDRSVNTDNVKPNIGYGNHLKMTTDTVVKLQPVIKANAGTVTIRNLQIKPASLPYSTGFIQTSNWIDFLFNNRNDSLLWDDVLSSFPKLYGNMKKFLLPYNVVLEDQQLRKDMYKNIKA